MIKKLTKSGNGYALHIDRSIMDLLEITPETPLKLSTSNGKSLHVEPVREGIRDKDVRAAAQRFKKKYGKAMRRLAE